jgi:hypothetical protein
VQILADLIIAKFVNGERLGVLWKIQSDLTLCRAVEIVLTTNDNPTTVSRALLDKFSNRS